MCVRRGFWGRPESPQKTRAIQSAFLQADCGKIVSVFSVGARPLLQGLARRSLGKPRFKQSTGLFEIHPLPSARSVRVFRRLRSSAKKLRILECSALDPRIVRRTICLSFTRKGWAKNLSCLWQALIGRSDPQTLICGKRSQFGTCKFTLYMI